MKNVSSLCFPPECEKCSYAYNTVHAKSLAQYTQVLCERTALLHKYCQCDRILCENGCFVQPQGCPVETHARREDRLVVEESVRGNALLQKLLKKGCITISRHQGGSHSSSIPCIHLVYAYGRSGIATVLMTDTTLYSIQLV